MGQLAAEVSGCREEFAFNVLGKRKAEAAAAMQEVRLCCQDVNLSNT